MVTEKEWKTTKSSSRKKLTKYENCLITQQKASRLLQLLLFCLFVCQQKPS